MTQAKISSTNSSSAPQAVKQYLQSLRAEWFKIAWPTWPQIWGQTIVVLVMVIVISFGLFLIDNLFSFMITLIIPHL